MTDLPKHARIAMPSPISTNGLYRNVRGVGRVATTKYTAWKRLAAQYLSAQAPLPRFEAPVTVLIYFGEQGVGGMDADNTEKAYLDALKRAGIIVDDSRKWVRGVAAHWTPGLCGAVVVIETAGDQISLDLAFCGLSTNARELLT